MSKHTIKPDPEFYPNGSNYGLEEVEFTHHGGGGGAPEMVGMNYERGEDFLPFTMTRKQAQGLRNWLVDVLKIEP